jgi:hypothetical protein
MQRSQAHVEMGHKPPKVCERHPVGKSYRSDGQALDGRRAGPNGKVLTPCIRGGAVSMGKSSSHGPLSRRGGTGRHRLRTNAKVLPPAPWMPRMICDRLAAFFAIGEMRNQWRRAMTQTLLSRLPASHISGMSPQVPPFNEASRRMIPRAIVSDRLACSRGRYGRINRPTGRRSRITKPRWRAGGGARLSSKSGPSTP